jgi:CMP-N-acetylneuraminic acid synthetase
MKIVALIPFWLDYKTSINGIECRPLIHIGGESLINRTVKMLNRVDSIDEVVVFSSNEIFLDSLNDEAQYKFLKRSKHLDSNDVSIEDVIENFLLNSDADIIVLIHPKSPFIRPETIQDCINKVLSPDFDSAFVASLVRKHAWFKGELINCSRNGDTPLLPNIDPILVETSSVYVFTKKLFDSERHRIGERPYVKEVGHFEGFEIDREDDFEMAELIINAGLDRERG